jgi:cytochrome c
MFKLSHKKIITISAVAAAVTFAACAGDNTGTASVNADGKTRYIASHTYDFNGKKVVDGGVTYPIINGKTGPYSVNTKARTTAYNKGREAKEEEIKAWNLDVMYNGPFPEGKGTVAEGEEIYEEKCVSCHGDFGSGAANVGIYPALTKGNAYELQQTLKNQRLTPDDEGPVRVFGSYWPYPSTALWYIKTGMPHPAPKSLSWDETYALVAYMLMLNELKVDGEVVEDDDFELNQDNFAKIEMPNVNGFVPDIRGEQGQENIRKYMNTPHNYGGKTLADGRCMKDCMKEVKVQRIAIEQKNFIPPLSQARDLPKKKEAIDPKAAYENSCAMCHSNGAGPQFGSKADWAKYTAKGMDKVYANGIAGTAGGMPPKGGTDLSDADFKSVVDYIIKNSK